MPTNDRKINIYHKRLLSMTALKSNFLEFLEGEIDEATAAMYQGTSGVLDGDEIELNNDTGGDTFDLDLTNAFRVIVGTGQIVDLSKITGVGITEGIPFENTTAIEYQVGIKFAEIEDGVEVNPRSGDAEYPSIKQTYGEKGTPGSVVDNTTYIRLNINSITESGVDHSGRTVRCWLVDPVSQVEGIAYFEGTSAYSGPDNYVDIPYSGSNGPLGQDTGVDPPSTTAADYVVFIEGATWRRNYAIAGDSDYAFLGTITGGVTPGFSIVGQQPIFINTLDRAYDGASGSGSGRIVTVDSGAMELNTLGGNTDEHGAQLRLNRQADTFDGGLNLELIFEREKGAGLIVLKPLVHATGNLLLSNPIDIDDNEVAFTGGGINLNTSNVRDGDFLLIGGSSSADGLYVITLDSATDIFIYKPGSIGVSLAIQSGNATVLRAIKYSGSVAYNGDQVLGPNSVSGLNEDTSPPTYAAHEIYPNESNAVHVRRQNTIITKINKDANIETRELIVAPAVRTSTSDPDSGLVLDAVNLDLKAPYNSLHKIKTPVEDYPLRMEAYGRIAKAHIFEDDFFYHYANWSSAATSPPSYKATVVGTGAGGSVATYNPAAVVSLTGGVVRLVSNDDASDATHLFGPPGFNIKPANGLLKFMCRYLTAENTYREDFIGISDVNEAVGYKIGFRYYEPSGTPSTWYFYVNDGTNVVSVNTTISPSITLWKNMYFAIIDNTHISFWMEGMANELTVDLAAAGPGAITLASENTNFFPRVRLTTNENSSKTGYLDYWHIHSGEAISGTLPATPT